MLNVKKMLIKMLDQSKDYQENGIIVEPINVSISLANQRYKQVDTNVAKGGYTPIGVVGWNLPTVDYSFSRLMIIGTTLRTYLWRAANITATVDMTIYVLYRKDV